jgi:hypothetical protein
LALKIYSNEVLRASFCQKGSYCQGSILGYRQYYMRLTRLDRYVTLNAQLRRSLPSYAYVHLEPALTGDIEKALSLLFAAPPHMRGDIALFFHLRSAPTALQCAVLDSAWTDSSQYVIEAAQTLPCLRAMFRAAKCPIPDTIPAKATVWRGTDRHNRHGFCWTLDRAMAVWFARRVSFSGGSGVVLSSIVLRRDILFYSNEREESECVIFNVSEPSLHELDSFGSEEGKLLSGPTACRLSNAAQ